MHGENHISYLKRKDIDLKKWDDCIAKAGNGLIYANSIYLDAMAENWDALVQNDYEAVMPLTWKKKYGICYLYQPFLCAQLGVFGNELSKDLVNDFLKAVPKQFRYWDIYLNHQNNFINDDYSLYQRNNFVLPLNKPYELLAKNYRENIHRNIKKANNTGCSIKKDFAVAEVTNIAKEQMHGFANISDKDFERFEKLYQQLHLSKQAITYGVVNAKEELLASCVFTFSHNRAYYILVGNHPVGKTLGASHMLIDAFIKDHAEKNMILDFEGSDIRNLAFFYSSFGAVEEKYAAIKLNRLPFYLKWLKK